MQKSVLISIKFKKMSSKLLVVMLVFFITAPELQSFALGSCAAYSLDGNKCEKCIQNYHIYEGKCYIDILGCQIYNFGNICRGCKKNNILVNNYCCDKTCISQLYIKQDPNSQVDQMMEQSQLLQKLLLKVSKQLLKTSPKKLIGISYKKYQQVVRFFLLYQLVQISSTYQRFIHDYHFAMNEYLLVDDALLVSVNDFQRVQFQTITDLSEVIIVLSLLPTWYSGIDPSLTMIKLAKLNRVKQYQIVVHNQNTLRSFYVYLNKTVFLYDLLLTPEYLQILTFGGHLNHTIDSLPFMSQCKQLISKSQNYAPSSVKSILIRNYTVNTQPLQVLVYSQGQNILMKSIFKVQYTNVNVVSSVKIISISKQAKKSTGQIYWGTYLQNQDPQISKVLMLVFSGYNSTLQIPSDFKEDSSVRKNIQWQLKIQKWKIFTKYNLHITHPNFSIKAAVLYLAFLNEYRIDHLLKISNVTQTIQKTVNLLNSNFTINEEPTPYERTLEGWPMIQTRMKLRSSIKILVQFLFAHQNYKSLGKSANLSRIIQRASAFFIDYTCSCQNSTHFLKITFSNNTINGTVTMKSSEAIQKKRADFSATINSQYHTKPDIQNGVYVFYAHNSLGVIYTKMNYSHASNLQKRMKDTFYNFYNDSKTIKSIYEKNQLYPDLRTNKNMASLKLNITAQIVQYHECPTAPATEYHMVVGYGIKGHLTPAYCSVLFFVEILQDGEKKLIYNGVVNVHENQYPCKFKQGSWSNHTRMLQWNFGGHDQFFRDNNSHLIKYEHFQGFYSDVALFFYVSSGQVTTPFQTQMLSLGQSINQYYKSLKNQNNIKVYRYLYNAQYIKISHFKNDPVTNLTYQFINLIPGGYYRNSSKPMPTYSGLKQRSYSAMCPGVNNSFLLNMYTFIIANQSQVWKNPHVNDFYSAYAGKQRVYNTQFFQNILSQSDRININTTLNLIQRVLKVETSLFVIKEYVRKQYKNYILYLLRLNNTKSNVLYDVVSIQDIGTKQVELVSWIPFYKQQLQNYSIGKPLNFTLIQNNNYFANVTSNLYMTYFKVKLGQVDQRIEEAIADNFLKMFNLTTFINQKFKISHKKVFTNSYNFTTQTSIITFIVEVSNLSYSSQVYGQNTTLIKTYYTVPMMFKLNSTRNSTTNVTTCFYYPYLLEIRKIEGSSYLNAFLISQKVTQNISVQKTMANYTVDYSYNFYSNKINQSGPVSPTPNATKASHFNMITYGANASQGTERFGSLKTDEGRVLQDGEILRNKYYPDNSIIQSSLPQYAQYADIYNLSLGSLLVLVQTKFTEKLSIQNISPTVLIIQKLSDSVGFISYSILIQAKVVYQSLISGKQETASHILRFVYLSYKTRFYPMGKGFLPESSYQSIISDIKAESNIYFEPLSKISHLNYVSSFISSTLNLINQYIVSLKSAQRAIEINNVYFRNYVGGGFYKIHVNFKSGTTGIAYMVQMQYQYKIFGVQMVSYPALPNTNNTNTSNSTQTNPSANTTTNLQKNQTAETNNASTGNNTSNATNPSNSTQQNNTIITLESQLFATNTTKGSLYYNLQQIILKLRNQFSTHLNNSTLKEFSIKQSPDGQFYHLAFQKLYLQGFYLYDVMIYRCNTTCLLYKGNLGSLYILNFLMTQFSLTGTIISTKSVLNTTATSFASVINGSQYQTNGSTSNNYYLNRTDQQTVITIFEQYQNLQNMTNVDPKLIEYQKYADFMKQYQSIVLSNGSKLLSKADVNNQVLKVLNYLRQKYLTILNNSILLAIVQNQQLESITRNTIYLLIQKQSNTSSVTKEWIIYRVSVSTQETVPSNFQIRVISFSQFAKNGILIDNSSNYGFDQNQTDKFDTDIAFGYAFIDIQAGNNDIDLQFTLNELKAKYSSLILGKTLKSIQKLQLKNGTNNYKIIFEDSISGDKLKIIAVYKKQLRLVQILNKLYLPRVIYRQALQTQVSNNFVFKNNMNVIYNLHSQLLTSTSIIIKSVQISQQFVSQTSRNMLYRIKFSADNKVYSSIVEYCPEANSFTELSFNQAIQIVKDEYRLNEFQQLHAKRFAKLTPAQLSSDNLYSIVQNKIKSQNINFKKTMVAYKRSQAFGFSYKVIHSIKTDSYSQINLFETIVCMDPINKFIQVKQKPLKLNMSEGFINVLQGQIIQQDLRDIAHEFSFIVGLKLQNMIIQQSNKKQFLDGMLLKLIIKVKVSQNTSKTYEALAFKQFYQQRFKIWATKSLLTNFQSCSANQSCLKCINQQDYNIYNGICLLKVDYCVKYQVDMIKNFVKCSECLDTYQLFEGKCISKQNYPQILTI